jgi:DNA (cytosine-5)-methyltransferase 1
MSLTVGSLFAGIGGFDIGLERAGMRVRWQVECEPWCQYILNKHWPDVPCYSDIRDVRGKEVDPVDILCGGFPCQDISNAGKRARSSLWKEYARLVDELRPRYVIVENVAVLRRRGLDVVLGDLSTLGYDAEWDCLRASDFGAPHRRDRLWLVAYARGEGRWEVARGAPSDEGSDGRRTPRDHVADRSGACGIPGGQGPVAVADARGVGQRESADQADALAGGGDTRRVFGGRGEFPTVAGWDPRATWLVEPDVGRVAHGIPARTHRLRGLGNALVPQIAEWIGRRILDYEGLGSGADADPRVA